MSNTRTARWRYTGARDAQGQPLEFHTGIPARDLEEEDVAALSSDDYALVKASPIYAPVADKPAHDAKADAKSGKE